MEMNKEIGMVTREGMGPRAQCGYLCSGRESWGCGHSYWESHRPSGVVMRTFPSLFSCSKGWSQVIQCVCVGNGYEQSSEEWENFLLGNALGWPGSAWAFCWVTSCRGFLHSMVTSFSGGYPFWGSCEDLSTKQCSRTHRILCNCVKSACLEPHQALVGKCHWQDIMKVISGVIKAALYYIVP